MSQRFASIKDLDVGESPSTFEGRRSGKNSSSLLRRAMFPCQGRTGINRTCFRALHQKSWLCLHSISSVVVEISCAHRVSSSFLPVLFLPCILFLPLHPSRWYEFARTLFVFHGHVVLAHDLFQFCGFRGGGTCIWRGRFDLGCELAEQSLVFFGEVQPLQSRTSVLPISTCPTRSLSSHLAFLPLACASACTHFFSFFAIVVDASHPPALGVPRDPPGRPRTRHGHGSFHVRLPAPSTRPLSRRSSRRSDAKQLQSTFQSTFHDEMDRRNELHQPTRHNARHNGCEGSHLCNGGGGVDGTKVVPATATQERRVRR